MALTDDELVEFLHSHNTPMDSQELTLLIYRYTRIIRIKASKLRKNASVDDDDLFQEGVLGLIDAVRSYKKERGKFQPYAEVCIANRMKTALAKESNGLSVAEDYDFTLITDESAQTEDYVILKERNEELYVKLGQLLSQKELSVLNLYLSGFSYKQISEKLSIPLKSVDNSLARSRQKLKKYF